MEAHLAISVTLLLALIAAVWRMSAITTELKATASALEARDVETAKRLERLDTVLGTVPVMQRDIEVLKTDSAETRRRLSEFPKALARIQSLEDWRGSQRGMKAVGWRPSNPDPEESGGR